MIIKRRILMVIYITVVIVLTGCSFERAQADHVPENLGLDDEARQEMIHVEPRSFIPHPRPSRSDGVSQTGISSDETKPSTNKDELYEEHNGSGAYKHEDEEEVDKDDEGSSVGSGEASISLEHNETNSQKQERIVLPLGSLTAEPIKSYSHPAATQFFNISAEKTNTTDNQPTPLTVTSQVNHSQIMTHENNIRNDNEEKTEDEQDKEDKNNGPQHEEGTKEDKDEEEEDTKDNKENENSVNHQQSSVVNSLRDVQVKDGAGSKGNIGDALDFGLKSSKPQTKVDGFPGKDNNVDSDDENERGSGIDGEKPATSNLDDKEKTVKVEENKDEPEGKNVDNPEVDNDKKVGNDKVESEGDDNVDQDLQDNTETSGSGNLPAEQMTHKPTLASMAHTSQDKSNEYKENDADKVISTSDDEGEEEDSNVDEDKMEDALNNEIDVYEDEDEDEVKEPQLDHKEKEDQRENTSEGMNGVESSTQQQHTDNETFHQSTVHKLPNKNASNIHNPAAKALPLTPSQVRRPSTVHKAKSVQKLVNETKETKTFSTQHLSPQRPDHTVKKGDDSKTATKTTETKKPVKKVKNTDHVVKVTHHAAKTNRPTGVNLAHHTVKHGGGKKAKKSKSLLKYIHRHKLQNHVRGGAKLNKTTPRKCNSDDIKTGYSLKGGTRAGHVEDLGGSANMHECIQRCCHHKVCDVALMLDGRCFGVACYSKELCKPIVVPHPHFVSSQIAFLDRAQKRDELEGTRPGKEFDCKYGELTIRNNHRWSGELCGGVVTCRNGVVTVEKCPGVPPKPTNCANPKLLVKPRPGQCCIKKWICKDKSCEFGGRRIPHGVSLSDQLCTGVVKCMNGHLQMKECPKLPEKPKNCASPKLKITTIPGQCCKKQWVCPDKSCTYGKLKVDDGERLTDASCAVVMECKNGFLEFKQCPDPPAVPNACLNPTLKVKRILGECCHMKWTCAQDMK